MVCGNVINKCIMGIFFLIYIFLRSLKYIKNYLFLYSYDKMFLLFYINNFNF